MSRAAFSLTPRAASLAHERDSSELVASVATARPASSARAISPSAPCTARATSAGSGLEGFSDGLALATLAWQVCLFLTSVLYWFDPLTAPCASEAFQAARAPSQSPALKRASP